MSCGIVSGPAENTNSIYCDGFFGVRDSARNTSGQWVMLNAIPALPQPEEKTNAE